MSNGEGTPRVFLEFYCTFCAKNYVKVVITCKYYSVINNFFILFKNEKYKGGFVIFSSFNKLFKPK